VTGVTYSSLVTKSTLETEVSLGAVVSYISLEVSEVCVPWATDVMSISLVTELSIETEITSTVDSELSLVSELLIISLVV
jgi:hypothetical protein